MGIYTNNEKSEKRRKKLNEWIMKMVRIVRTYDILFTKLHHITKSMCRNNRKWFEWNWWCYTFGWLFDWLTNELLCDICTLLVSVCACGCPLLTLYNTYIRSGIRWKFNNQTFFRAMNWCTVKLPHFNIYVTAVMIFRKLTLLKVLQVRRHTANTQAWISSVRTQVNSLKYDHKYSF